MSETMTPSTKWAGVGRSGPLPLNGVSARGYKSIVRPQSIEIRPLTILAGANSSGKSSIIQPILLLKQTLQASYDPGALLLDGPNVKFTSTDQFFSRTGEGRSDELEVGISVGAGNVYHFWIRVLFKRHADKGLRIKEMTFSEEGLERIGLARGTLRPGMTQAELEEGIPSWPKVLQPFPTLAIFPGLERKPEPAELQMTVRQYRCFLELVSIADISGHKYIYQSVPALSLGQLMQIVSLIHLPALRGNPRRTYPVTAVAQDTAFPGTFDNYVASVVAGWETDRKSDILSALNESLENLGLTSKITAKRLDETQIELSVGRLPHGKRGAASDLVSLADVGFGVSQALPVVVALLVARPGQTVYLEEPEIHLHPKAQRQMAQVLAAAAKRGVHVIAETHSSLLLRGIQTLVATGELPPELVKLHWFSRKAEDGSTEIHSADLDKEGAFGDWPEDFDEVALEAEKQYLDAAESSGQR